MLAYAPKYASAFFGPFREAVDSSLGVGISRYQQDPSRGVREALSERLPNIRRILNGIVERHIA